MQKRELGHMKKHPAKEMLGHSKLLWDQTLARTWSGRSGTWGWCCKRSRGGSSAHSIAASTILTIIMVAAAGILNVVATATGIVTASILTIIGTAGVLAVTVPAAAAMTSQVLLER